MDEQKVSKQKETTKAPIDWGVNRIVHNDSNLYVDKKIFCSEIKLPFPIYSLRVENQRVKKVFLLFDTIKKKGQNVKKTQYSITPVEI